ncbi:MAG: Mov34/MPN/PAD-1 family protein [Leptolyngbyaceae cyanobacterium bins.302]|nr:Mov34/MPN/PAD-1 family protein [Leptolyngbyaceae cyanobacterium bins.302]
MMKFLLKHLLDKESQHKYVQDSIQPKVILTKACFQAMHHCLLPEIKKGHEGISYLLGRTDSNVTVAITATRPQAHTTPGSFHVSSPAMAQIVRSATNFGLQVVAQVHTHPGEAFHSEGDEKGARNKYPGYVSIVLPNYGRHLPNLERSAVFIFQANQGFIPLPVSELIITPEVL